jgi:hypothetical protein
VRCAAADKHDIRDCTDAEVTAAFAALKPKLYRNNNPPPPVDAEGNPLPPDQVSPYPDPKLRYGFLVDDVAADPATKDIATFAYIPGTEGTGFEPIGTDVMQVLTLTIARLKQLESELATLRKEKK